MLSQTNYRSRQGREGFPRPASFLGSLLLLLMLLVVVVLMMIC